MNGYSTGTGILPLDGRLGERLRRVPAIQRTPFVANGATVGNVTTQPELSGGLQCNQDLRLNFEVHTTDLVFNVFNAMEVGYSDANVCVDSTALIPLNDSNSNLKSRHELRLQQPRHGGRRLRRAGQGVRRHHLQQVDLWPDRERRPARSGGFLRHSQGWKPGFDRRQSL